MGSPEKRGPSTTKDVRVSMPTQSCSLRKHRRPSGRQCVPLPCGAASKHHQQKGRWVHRREMKRERERESKTRKSCNGRTRTHCEKREELVFQPSAHLVELA